MNVLKNNSYTSVAKKQVVAATGLALILFVVGHLAGNLTFYLGPEVFNAYAEKLAHLRPGLYVIEGGLLALFLVHIWFTALVVYENYRARPLGYYIRKSTEKRNFATSVMPYTGTIIVAFVIWHLIDFTFADKQGVLSVLGQGPESSGLYGLVYNGFSNPVHALLYVIAMIAVGLHLSHGIQSFFQTFGILSPASMPVVKKTSNILAIMVSVLFSSIPLYVLFWAPVY